YFHFTLYNALGEDKVVLGHITDLQYNEADRKAPFNAFGKDITHAFNLLPWEDMVEQSLKSSLDGKGGVIALSFMNQHGDTSSQTKEYGHGFGIFATILNSPVRLSSVSSMKM
ncbi:hypothetical protein LMH73_020075, partial [Vibrio splendidus]